MKYEVDKRLLDSEHKLKSLGPARETDNQQRTFLLDLAARFQEITSHALDAYYGRSSLFGENPSLRLATRIVDLNTAFSNNIWLKGHTIYFNKFTTRNSDEPAAELPDETLTESPDDADQAATVDISYSASETDKPEDSKFPELSDVI